MSDHAAMTLDHERRLAQLEALDRAPKAYRASLYQDDSGTVITIAATNTDYTVTGMTALGLYGFTEASSVLTVATDGAGWYGVVWQMSMTSASANQEIEGCVYVGTTRQANTSSHRKFLATTDTGSFSGCGEIQLAAGDQVTLRVRNETDTNNVAIQHANLIIWRLGLA